MTPLGDAAGQAIRTLTQDARQFRANAVPVEGGQGAAVPDTVDRIEVSPADETFGGQSFASRTSGGEEPQRLALLSGDIDAFGAEPASEDADAGAPAREPFEPPSRSIGELADAFARNAAAYARAEAVRALAAGRADDARDAEAADSVRNDAEVETDAEASAPTAVAGGTDEADDVDRSAGDAGEPGAFEARDDADAAAPINADTDVGVEEFAYGADDLAADIEDVEVTADAVDVEAADAAAIEGDAEAAEEIAEYGFDAAGDEAADAALNVALDATEGPAPEPADLAFEEYSE